ncbi:LysR family transcriptional regulator [Bordetella bronchialis]|uniref:LysR family transcriptional regulator n=1 Tax=Bordetella bronchialis TaxID=463025 RepID=A0A193FIZ8_9BORD|nr:LysR family transcriptional regulator [Bordetella bronchialis]ANN67084.1 LysR family transcriptional regulator [Bordetella bronchialis]ANN72161.1 LysR family transcriptional regulator [Bordetella bronchialis]
MKEPTPEKGGADRLTLIDTFVRIVNAGSLSAAAEQLGATQPTVSRRLQALERAVGVRLIQRSTHGMQLTEEGRRCYDRAEELIASWQAFDSEVRGAGQQPVGTLRVVVPHAFGQQEFVRPLATYLRRYPGMRVEWLLNDRMPDFISDGVDCAIRVGEVQDESVVAIRLGDVPRIIVAAPALLDDGPVPDHPNDLARLPWLALRTFYRDEVALNNTLTGEAVRLPIQPRMATDSLYALRTAAILGLGVCVASTWIFEDDLRQGRLRQLAPGWQAHALPLNLVYPASRLQPRRLRAFIDTMRAELPRGPGN